MLDDVVVPTQSVATRNFIRGKDGRKVLIYVPIKHTNRSRVIYREAQIDYSGNWQLKHLYKIEDAYLHTPYFKEVYPVINDLFMERYPSLGDFNITAIKTINEKAGIATPVRFSSEMNLGHLKKSEKNMEICKYLGAHTYLSGTGAKSYNDERVFIEQNMHLVYQEYRQAEYPQLHTEFISGLSILDFLFNSGFHSLKPYLEQT